MVGFSWCTYDDLTWVDYACRVRNVVQSGSSLVSLISVYKRLPNLPSSFLFSTTHLTTVILRTIKPTDLEKCGSTLIQNYIQACHECRYICSDGHVMLCPEDEEGSFKAQCGWDMKAPGRRVWVVRRLMNLLGDCDDDDDYHHWVFCF
jgi:hypothetical protein